MKEFDLIRTHNVDDKEDGALLGSHGEIRPFRVSLDGVCRRRGDQTVIDDRRRPQLTSRCVSSKGKNEYDDEDNDGVNVISEERGFDSGR